MNGFLKRCLKRYPREQNSYFLCFLTCHEIISLLITPEFRAAVCLQAWKLKLWLSWSLQPVLYFLFVNICLPLLLFSFLFPLPALQSISLMTLGVPLCCYEICACVNPCMQCMAENMRWKRTGVDSRYVVNLFQQHSDFSVTKKKPQYRHLNFIL